MVALIIYLAIWIALCIWLCRVSKSWKESIIYIIMTALWPITVTMTMAMWFNRRIKGK